MSLGEQFEQLLGAAREGQAWALAEIYRDIHPRLVRFLRVKWGTDAEDLASEVWIDVAEGLHRFAGGEGDLNRWIFTIAWRRLLDARRQAMRRQTAPVAQESMAGLVGGDVEEESLAELGWEAALKMVSGLPEDQATIVLLRVVAGFDADEVAAILGKRPGTIRVMQHRALRRLQRLLTEQEVTTRNDGRYTPRDATPRP